MVKIVGFLHSRVDFYHGILTSYAIMSSKPRPEASSAKRGKTVPKKKARDVLGASKKKGPSQRHQKTGKPKPGTKTVSKRPATTPRPPKPADQCEAVKLFEGMDTSDMDPIESRCVQFVINYLRTHSCRGAANAMGVPLATAQTVGMRYFRHPFTQKLLRTSMLDPVRDRKLVRQVVLERLTQEADEAARFQETGSHRARVAALEALGKFTGLDEKTVNVKGSGGPIGVIAMPHTMSREEWEKTVTEKQETLKKRSKMKPTEEKSVL